MKSFYIEITTGPVLLTEDEIWPDHDKPENMTTDDVHQAIKDSGMRLWNLADEWFINDHAEVFISEGPNK